MSRKYSIHIQPEAESNMEEAYQWLLEKAPAYAADWFNGLVGEFRRLEVHPEKFPLAPENRFGMLSARFVRCSMAEDSGNTAFSSSWRDR